MFGIFRHVTIQSELGEQKIVPKETILRCSVYLDRLVRIRRAEVQKKLFSVVLYIVALLRLY